MVKILSIALLALTALPVFALAFAEDAAPGGKVLKDGFGPVGCVKDYMFYHGDKFGDNRHDYELGSVSGVSIVHYDTAVAKEDQQQMTQKVCFEYCRTVPGMGFFGIVNGRSCYCTPYFTRMESDSSQCDVVCEGEHPLVCGGKSKSSIFALHMCDSTAKDLSTMSGTASALKSNMEGKIGLAKGFSKDLQQASEILQESFGAVGDSGAANIMQAAKVFAGKLVHKAEDAEKVAGKLGSLSNSGAALQDFTSPDTVLKAERIMEDMGDTIGNGEDVIDELDKLNALAKYEPVHEGAAKQYYPVMYFVDKDFDNVPSTCAGDMIGEPMLGSADSCASACDANIHSCVGYGLFVYPDGNGGCTLFSNFKTAFYYTGCGKSFLQSKKKEAPFSSTCFAKLSKFEGTTLKPDPSGKCKECFKKVTKADRCYG